jgi:hypothetical protein
MDWNNFPLDMQEFILSFLPVVELARLAMTCRSFHTASRRHLAEQQKARCDLAEQWICRKRIMGVIDLVSSFFRGDCITPTRHKTYGWISADGVFHVLDQASCQSGGEAIPEVGEIEVVIFATRPGFDKLTSMNIVVYGPGKAVLAFVVSRFLNTVYSTVTRSDGEDLSGLAFVQALLTCGFGREQAGVSPLKGHIIWCCLPQGSFLTGMPWANPKLLAQIAPLLPLLHKSQFGLSLYRGYAGDL